ncbi:MAG: hypothetical protein ABIJ81_00605 [Patescibacteria group bacterium]
MYLTVHGAAALIIARAIPNPIIAFLVSLLSHFILDFIPHGDEFLTKSFTPPRALRRLFGAAIIDGILLVFFVLLYLVVTPDYQLSLLSASLFGALLPDLLMASYLITKTRWLKKFTYFHSSLHNWLKYHLSWQQGIVVQVFTFTALWLSLI